MVGGDFSQTPLESPTSPLHRLHLWILYRQKDDWISRNYWLMVTNLNLVMFVKYKLHGDITSVYALSV